MKKRIAAILFATVMLFSCFSVTAFAETPSYDYNIGDKATTASRDVLPEGNIPENSVWMPDGQYNQEVYTCGKEDHPQHNDECYNVDCKHVHNFICGLGMWCFHECNENSGCVTLDCENGIHRHKKSCIGYQTIYKWKLEKGYVVVWKNGNNELERDVNVAWGDVYAQTCSVTPVKAPTAQYTYTFNGWYDPTYNRESRVWTYYAKFTRTVNEYTITWVDEDGTTVLELDENVPYGTTPSYDGENPTKAGNAQFSYEFIGWTPTVESVTGDATYIATYKETVNTYTVTWYDEDGTTELEVDEEVAYGSTPSFDGEEPTKAADSKYTYKFAGWEKIEPKANENDATVAQEVAAEDEKDVVTGDTAYKATYTATEIPAKDDAAKTGDDMNTAIYFGLMLFAALGMMAVVLKKRNA